MDVLANNPAVDASPDADEFVKDEGSPNSPGSPRHVDQARNTDTLASRQEVEDLMREVRDLRREKIDGEKNAAAKAEEMEELLREVRDLTGGGSATSLGEEEGDDKLEEDVFSLMYVSRTGSLEFVFGTVVFLFQIAILVFTLVDLLDQGDSPYPLTIPPGVDWQVSASQVLCLLIAVAVQQDLLTSFAELSGGYTSVFYAPSSPSFGAANSRNPVEVATKAKWILSNSCRLVEGALGLVVSFFLIVQSYEVIDLYFNFAALVFISELDNIAFWLVDNGFMFSGLRGKTAFVKGCVLGERPKKTNCLSKHCQSALVIATLLGLFGGWAFFFARQVNGSYLPQYIRAEFGDLFNQELGLFSGEYKATRTQSSSRVQYANVYSIRHGAEGRGVDGIFFFCKDLESWVFVLRHDREDCEKEWLARSPMTDSYDITDTSPSDWFIKKTSTNIFTPADFFSLTSSDCSKVRSEELTCNEHGQCVEEQKGRKGGLCHCDEGWWGLNCQYRYPCPQINHLNDRERFPGLEPPSLKGDVATNGVDEIFSGYVYDRFLRVFGKPVYYRRNARRHQSSKKYVYELLVFTGRRWVVTTNELLGIQSFGNYLGRKQKKYALEVVIVQKLFAGSDIQNFSWVLYVSEPADDATARVQNASPDGLKWFDVRELEENKLIDFEEMEEVGTSLHCELCRLGDVYATCKNGGVCVPMKNVQDSVRRIEEDGGVEEDEDIVEKGLNGTEEIEKDEEIINRDELDAGDLNDEDDPIKDTDEDDADGDEEDAEVDEDDIEESRDTGNQSDDQDTSDDQDDVLETNYKVFNEENWGECECEETVGPLCQYEIDENNNCYDIDMVFEPDCTCHESCSKCGTRGNDPYDCLACKDSAEAPSVIFDLGTRAGCCTNSGNLCPKCDISCALCGSELNNCVGCATGYTADALKNADGTLLCIKNASPLTTP